MKLIAISIAMEDKEFKYIDAEESIMCLDWTRQDCLLIDKTEVSRSKTTTRDLYVCTKNNASMTSQSQETLAVKIFMWCRNITKSRDDFC
jgi:hypothetical protein